MTAPTRQPLPRTPEAARAELQTYRELLTLAGIRYQAARRALDLARDNLRAVEGIANGEFEPDAPLPDTNYYGVTSGPVLPVRTYAVGSHGSWAV